MLAVAMFLGKQSKTLVAYTVMATIENSGSWFNAWFKAFTDNPSVRIVSLYYSSMVQGTQLDRSPTDDDKIEELLSNSLLRLKFQDRNEIREEVHGACCLAPEETPEFIHHSLNRMNQELEAILSASREDHAYQQARYLPNTFVNDREFRLKFLRCELFDPAKAADRMILHLDYILLLFGPRSLREPLTADFFVKEEAAALRQGYMQLLPFRDRSGRRVITFLSGIFTYSPRLRVRKYQNTLSFG